jgi:hypothetical protein
MSHKLEAVRQALEVRKKEIEAKDKSLKLEVGNRVRSLKHVTKS